MIPSPLRGDIGTGILHLGLGAFHRAHQAAYTQDAVAAAGGDWGIEAVSMRNPALADALTAQGGRYTLIERHAEGPRLLDMSVIRRAWALPGNAARLVARMADPSIRIVTITVTEKGYGADLAARRLNRADAVVAHDLANRAAPRQSLVGHLVAGLAARRDAGSSGLTVMSCDNLPENGTLLACLIRDFAAEVDPGLVDWIERHCRFPDSMVDRITPAANEATFAIAEAALGRPDPGAIETEPFRQWVIEDNFAGPRPEWETAGAQLVRDVAPFEMMKLRLLNGSHSLIAYLGALRGLPAVRDVMANAELGAAVRVFMRHAAATLPPNRGLDAAAYAAALIARFENRAIQHRCLQIAADGSQKMPQRIFAPARERLETGGDISAFALATAGWIRFLHGQDETGARLDIKDPLADHLRRALQDAGSKPLARVAALARVPGLAHGGVLDNRRFAESVAALLEVFDGDGTMAAVRAAIQDDADANRRPGGSRGH